jgi:hypothetical protein
VAFGVAVEEEALEAEVEIFGVQPTSRNAAARAQDDRRTGRLPKSRTGQAVAVSAKVTESLELSGGGMLRVWRPTSTKGINIEANSTDSSLLQPIYRMGREERQGALAPEFTLRLRGLKMAFYSWTHAERFSLTDASYLCGIWMVTTRFKEFFEML